MKYEGGALLNIAALFVTDAFTTELRFSRHGDSVSIFSRASYFRACSGRVCIFVLESYNPG